MTAPTPRPHLPGSDGRTPIGRRRLLVGLVAAPLFAALVSACGDPDVESATTEPDPMPSAPSDAIAHSTAPDDVILRLSYEGGFVPVDTVFLNLPNLVVSGDGRVFVPGAVPAIYPGPMLMPMGVRTITESGIQRLLTLAADVGLLGPAPDYTADLMIADAPDTVVRITVADGTFEHRAYALGIDSGSDGTAAAEATPARRTLLGYVVALGDLVATVGAAELGEETIFEPSEYRLRATAVDEVELSGLDPAPTIVDWPEAAGVDLATAGACARVEAAAVRELFGSADQLTHFRQEQVVYRVVAAGVLPGDPAC